MKRWNNLLSIAILILCVLAVLTFIWKGVVSAREPFSHGYVGYYAAFKLFIEEGWSAKVYDNSWFSAYSLSVSDGKVGEVVRPNIPTMAMVGFPTAFFPLASGRVVWVIEGMLFAVAGIVFLCAAIRPQKTWEFYGLTFAFALFFPPLIRNLEIGQAYLSIFFLLGLFLYGIQTKHDGLAGATLALAFMLKTAGLFLWFIPFIHRKWGVLVWGIGVSIFIALITLPKTGLDTWQAYPSTLWETNSDPILTATAYQSIPGLLNHLFRYHELWSPAPLLEAPALARTLVYGTAFLGLGYTLWKIRKASLDLQTAALLTLNTLIIPLVEEHQLVLMLIPITLLSANIVKFPFHWQRERASVLLLLAGVILLILPIPYKNPLLHVGWVSFLAYPRVYGNILLWILALKRVDVE